jgi:flagellar transcriptional activator FlhD
MFRLKIDSDVAELIVSLSARQLTRLARTSQLLCRFSQTSAERLRLLTDNPRDQGLAGLHASLLLANEPFEPMPTGEVK